jgi:hypothetical protein
MDRYLAVNTGRLNITRLLDVAKKHYKDLPTLPNYANLQGCSSICWNWVLGCCRYVRACIFQHGHVKGDNFLDTFADTLCVNSKGVVQLMNNGGGNVPQPPPNKKPKLGSDTPQQEE